MRKNLGPAVSILTIFQPLSRRRFDTFLLAIAAPSRRTPNFAQAICGCPEPRAPRVRSIVRARGPDARGQSFFSQQFSSGAPLALSTLSCFLFGSFRTRTFGFNSATSYARPPRRARILPGHQSGYDHQNCCRSLRCANAADLVENAKRITCPALFIRGDQEPTDNYPAELFKESCAGACEVASIPDSDQLYVDAEERVAATMTDRLKRTTSDPRPENRP